MGITGMSYRDGSNDSGARSSTFASVPHYARLTDPPKKKHMLLWDMLGLEGCPAARSEWQHLCTSLHISALHCAALHRNSAQEVRAVSVLVL